MSFRSLIKNILIEKQNKQYHRLLSRKQMSYPQWLKDCQRKDDCRAKNPRTAENSQIELCILHSEKGVVAQGIQDTVADYFDACPETWILYADEDVLEEEGEGKQGNPWFKPEWSPETFQSFFYFGSLLVIRKELAVRFGLWEAGTAPYQTAAPYKTIEKDNKIIHFAVYPTEKVLSEGITKLIEEAGEERRINHLPQILFHSKGEEVQKAYLRWQDNRIKGKLDEAQAPSQISVIIPSKDNPKILEACLKSLLVYGGKYIYEIIIVDNGSSEENKKTVEKLISDLTKGILIHYHYHRMEFNFSKMCNMGAQAAKGKVLLFLNDDVELYLEDSLLKMLRYAGRPHVGAVGLKLYYKKISDASGSFPEMPKRIQHVGITNLPMGPVHKLQFLEDNECYYFGRNKLDHNVLAVTGACLMVEKKKFWITGGFPQDMAVAFNDVELCFALYEAGYYNVVVNTSSAYHYESLSRGEDESPEKWQRLNRERRKLYEKHPKLNAYDPFYPWGLNRDMLDVRIRPAYLTAGNTLQEGNWQWKNDVFKDIRRDNCLLLRIEYCEPERIQGYGVILGDNNACYERTLVLLPAKESLDLKRDNGCYLTVLQEQYRPDLEENMKDQCNVSLAGFDVRIGENILRQGTYQVGMLVKNRVSGLKLYNISSRSISIR